jgi:hypothetical protein
MAKRRSSCLMPTEIRQTRSRATRKGFDQIGTASWYASSYCGHRTEPYACQGTHTKVSVEIFLAERKFKSEHLNLEVKVEFPLNNNRSVVVPA